MKMYYFLPVLLSFILIPGGAGISGGDRIVDHPDKLTYPELSYTPPDIEHYMEMLPGGIPVFITEDHAWPVFDIEVLVRTGTLHDPPEKAGLAGMTGSLLRDGGTAAFSPEDFEDRVAFLAAELTCDTRDDRCIIRLSILQKDMDGGLDLLKEMLEHPRFDEKQCERYTSDLMQNLKRRNDEPSGVERREWAFLLYGEHPHIKTFSRTGETLSRITREDLLAFHRGHFFPENYIISVTGDFDRKAVLQKLATIFPAGKGKEPLSPMLPERPESAQSPGVYCIDFPGASQARVSLGHLGIREGNPDYYALQIMNYILGGGGFSSRITRRVRSDEGLSYSQGSSLYPGNWYAGVFRAYFQSNNKNASKGIKIIMEEIERMRNEKVTGPELEAAKNAITGRLPGEFSDRFRTVRTFASDYYIGRPADFRKNYEQRINAVTAEDVQRVARKYLHPGKYVLLMVGNLEEVQETWDEEALGPIKQLPLRDPLTLK